MTTEVLPFLKQPLRPVRAVLYGALAVGVLDILDAIIFFGVRSQAHPDLVMHSWWACPARCLPDVVIKWRRYRKMKPAAVTHPRSVEVGLNACLLHEVT